MADYGLKVSKPNIDVGTATNQQDLVFTSTKGVLGVRQVSNYSGTTNASGNIALTFNHNFGYVPLCYVTVNNSQGSNFTVPIKTTSGTSIAKEFIEIYETFNYRIGSVAFYMNIHADTYNYDTSSTAALSNQAYTYKVRYMFNEMGTAI